MAEDVDEAIRESARGPKRARGDSGEVEQHDLKDQIDVDRYFASKKAAKGKRVGLRFAKLVPPGAD